MTLTISQLTAILIGIYNIITLGIQMYRHNSYTYDAIVGDKTLELLKDGLYHHSDIVDNNIIEFEFNDISFDYEIYKK